jgi:hypothetical protein
LADDFERHGVEAIERVSSERPETYLRVIASLLPKDLNLNLSKYDHLTDEQLMLMGREVCSDVDREASVEGAAESQQGTMA